MGWASPSSDQASQQDAEDHSQGIGHEVLGLEGALADHSLKEFQGCRVSHESQRRDDGMGSGLREGRAQCEGGVPGEVQEERTDLAEVRHLDAGGATGRQERGHGGEQGQDEGRGGPSSPASPRGQGLLAPCPGSVDVDERASRGQLLAHPRGRGATERRSRGDRALE